MRGFTGSLPTGAQLGQQAYQLTQQQDISPTGETAERVPDFDEMEVAEAIQWAGGLAGEPREIASGLIREHYEDIPEAMEEDLTGEQPDFMEALLDVQRLDEDLRPFGIAEMRRTYPEEIQEIDRHLPEDMTFESLMKPEDEKTEKEIFWSDYAELREQDPTIIQIEQFMAEHEGEPYFEELREFTREDRTIEEELWPDYFGV